MRFWGGRSGAVDGRAPADRGDVVGETIGSNGIAGSAGPVASTTSTAFQTRAWRPVQSSIVDERHWAAARR